MEFDRNQTEFRDCLQERAWELATRQVPLALTQPFIPDALQPACSDWYHFSRNLFADMYENPARFGFEVDAAQPDWMNRKQVDFYFWMVGGADSPSYEMTAAQYKKMLKKFNPKSVEALQQYHGFRYKAQGDGFLVSNALYPNMFLATKATTDFGNAKYKVNRGHFMMYCDFRVFEGYKRGYEDLLLVFSDERRQIAEEIHQYSVSRKILPQKCSYFFRVEYKHKGKLVFVTNAKDRNQFVIKIGFAEIGGKAFQRMAEEIEKDADAAEWQAFLCRHITKCQNCKQKCRNKENPVTLFGKKMIVCDASIRVLDPKDDALKYVLKTIELRAMVIQEGISDLFYPGSG